MPIAHIINKNQNKNIETNISEKLKGYVKINTFNTLYESFLKFKHFVSSKPENFNEENGEQRSLETKMRLLENEIQNLHNIKKDLEMNLKAS